MKKVLSSTFILILFLVVAWGVAGWYFGNNAESQLKHYLSESETIPGEKLFRAELLSYKKTLFGSKASLRVSSDISFVNERIGDFVLDVRSFNGPIFLHKKEEKNENKSFFEIGSTRWQLNIDESSVEKQSLEYLSSIFSDGLPHTVITTDFEDKAHYRSNLKTEYAEAVITGVYNLETEDNEGSILINKTQYGTLPNQIKAKRATINYNHQRGITASYKPGTTHITIPELEINHNLLDEPIFLNLTADAAIQSEEYGKELDEKVKNKGIQKNNSAVLNGLIKVHLKQNDSNQFPVEHADIKVQFSRIPAEGLIAISEERARQDNLYQQIQWTLEESAELPEGRDHIWQLKERLNRLKEELPEQISRSFGDKKSQILIDIKATKVNQHSTLNGKIKFAKSESVNLLSLLQGKAQVELSEDLLAFIKPLAQVDKKLFKLNLRKGKITQNN